MSKQGNSVSHCCHVTLVQCRSDAAAVGVVRGGGGGRGGKGWQRGVAGGRGGGKECHMSTRHANWDAHLAQLHAC